MNLLKQNLIKNLIFSAIFLAIASLFNLVMINQAIATYDIEPNIKQVKTSDNPTVYYLDHKRGLKKAYASETAFLSYGNKWSDIKIVTQELLDKWPDLNLVKTNNSNKVYYIENGQKALIESEQQFIDSGFRWSDIITILETDLAEYKTIDFKVAGAIGNFDNNRLTIALDASGSSADYLVANTQDNLAAIFSLKAEAGPVEIKQLVLDLNGIFNQDIIKEIYLTNESDIEYPVISPVNNRQAIFNFNNQPIIISPGEARQLKVYINLNETSADILNHTLAVAINQATSIAGAEAQGSFPIIGKTFKLISASGILEKVNAREQSLSIDNNQAIIGLTEKIIGKFKLEETSGRGDVFVKELSFANLGNSSATSINNFKLKNKAGQIVSTVAQLTSERKLIFKLKDYKIKKSGNETFTILTDVVVGGNSSINFDLEKAKVASSQGDFSLNVNIINLDEKITIKRKAIGVLAKELKANNKVFANESGIIIGNFEIRNNNQKINLVRLGFSLEKNSTMPGLRETIYLVNYNSGEIYGYFNGDKFNNGSVSIAISGLTLTPKQNLVVALVTMIPDNAPNGGYYKIILNNLDYRIDGGALLSDTIDSAGTKLTVSKSNLYLYPNNDLGEQVFTKGQKGVKIASFIIEGASGGDTKITDLTFSQGKDSSGIISFDNGFSNLRFYIGSTRVKTIQNPYSGDLAVGSFVYILKSGTRAEIKVYADTEIDLKASEVQLAISNMAAVNYSSSIPAIIYNLNLSSYKVSFGTATAEISQVADGFVTKGENDNVIAGFRVKNTGDEDLSLQSITVNAANQELTYSLGYSNLRIVDRNLQKNAGSTISRPVAGANKIGLGGYLIKAGQEAIFDVHIKTSKIVADENVDIYFSDFLAQGKISKISALITGDPTNNFSFTVATSDIRKVFIKPVSGSITYHWHDAKYPYRNTSGEHTGIDMIASQGTKVKAAADGVIIEVVNSDGNQASYIAISHGAGLITKYAHLSRLDVQVGDSVKQGDIIGLSGGTPGTPGAGLYTNGAHLHFEVLLNGNSVDPEKYL
jgi:murein DD-endopeptidase MepM/ murein hydrolase activator NlpD